MNPRLVKLIFGPTIRRAARRSWVGRSRDESDAAKGRFTRTDVDELLIQTWLRFDQLAPDVPDEPKFGNRMNVLLAALTLAGHESLMAVGVERNYANALVADLAWKVYEGWGKLPILLAQLRFRRPARQMQTAVALFLKFPFTPPGYRFEQLPTTLGVDINMRRCPVADYKRSQNAADLCVHTWCNLDFPLAEMWGGRLERNQTLAAGDDICNFKFMTSSNGGIS